MDYEDETPKQSVFSAKIPADHVEVTLADFPVHGGSKPKKKNTNSKGVVKKVRARARRAREACFHDELGALSVEVPPASGGRCHIVATALCHRFAESQWHLLPICGSRKHNQSNEINLTNGFVECHAQALRCKATVPHVQPTCLQFPRSRSSTRGTVAAGARGTLRAIVGTTVIYDDLRAHVSVRRYTGAVALCGSWRHYRVLHGAHLKGAYASEEVPVARGGRCGRMSDVAPERCFLHKKLSQIPNILSPTLVPDPKGGGKYHLIGLAEDADHKKADWSAYCGFASQEMPPRKITSCRAFVPAERRREGRKRCYSSRRSLYYIEKGTKSPAEGCVLKDSAGER
ncbi:hypothetical protein K438DRAFT_1772701 [Mycena galopus ATCC 62051]|nr:hypothetical protein K438DRAFT_1772701 [Mycena galopus ATCC 62051]